VFTINLRGGRILLHYPDKKNMMITMKRFRNSILLLLTLSMVLLSSCATPSKLEVYRDPNFDFGAVRIVAVMPFENLTKETQATSRVRDVFMNMLLSTGAIYVLPSGEVARGLTRAGLEKATALSAEDAVRLGGIVKANAVITGVVREYGEVRSGSSSSNVISLSLQMMETQTGRVVWNGSSTRGGITASDRLFGGGGRPMDDVTRDAVIEVLNKLF
jgi:hypothetical protein